LKLNTLYQNINLIEKILAHFEKKMHAYLGVSSVDTESKLRLPVGILEFEMYFWELIFQNVPKMLPNFFQDSDLEKFQQ